MGWMFALQLHLLFGYELLFLLFVLVHHAVDAHAFLAVGALAGPETHL